MWLERSRTVPLSYTLSLPADLDDESHITMFRPFIRLLLLHAHHWSDVLIQSSNWDRMKRLPVPKDTAFPHLKRISLWGIDPRSLRFSLTSEQAPSLEAVVLSSPILHAWSLPWAQLQSLYVLDHEVNPDYYPNVMDVLSQCSHLRELRVQNRCTDDDDLNDCHFEPLPTGRIKLPCLQYLSVSTNNITILRTVLTSLSTPILAEFFVDQWEDYAALDIVIPFLSRHSATVKTLALGGATSWPFAAKIPDSLSRLWAHLPNMECLRIHHERGLDIIHSLLEHYATRKTDPSAASVAFIQELWLDVQGERFSGKLPAIVEIVAGLMAHGSDTQSSTDSHIQPQEGPDALSSSKSLVGPTREPPVPPKSPSLKKMHLRMGQYEPYPMIKKHYISEQAELRDAFQAAFGPFIQEGLVFSCEFVDIGKIMKECIREGDLWTRYEADFGYTLEWADDCSMGLEVGGCIRSFVQSACYMVADLAVSATRSPQWKWELSRR